MPSGAMTRGTASPTSTVIATRGVGYPPFAPFKTSARLSVRDTIQCGHEIRRKQKAVFPRIPAKAPLRPAKITPPIRKVGDAKLTPQAWRSYVRCLGRNDAVLPERLARLARPLYRHILGSWRQHAFSLTPEMILRLRTMLAADVLQFNTDQACQYFRNRNQTKKQKALRKQNLKALCDGRFVWKRNATVALARGIQQSLARPGCYLLADGMSQLSNVILKEICFCMRMRPPPRWTNKPRSKFMLEVADRVAMWIYEILSVSEERMLMEDCDEDDVVIHADEPIFFDVGYADEFLDMMAGKGQRLTPPKPAYLKFQGEMLEAFKLLTTAMYKRGNKTLVEYGMFSQTYKEAADDLRQATSFDASNYDTKVAKEINEELSETMRYSTPATCKNEMKEIIEICSNYLAQTAEHNKDKGKAFKYLVEKMRENSMEQLAQKGKTSLTMYEAAEILEEAKGLTSDHDDPYLSQAIEDSLTKLVEDAPSEMEDEMRETLGLVSNYLSQVIVDKNERGPAFDMMIEILEKNGTNPFMPNYPALGRNFNAAYVLKTAPGLKSVTPDENTASQFAEALHREVDDGTPVEEKHDMNEAIKRSANYLSGFNRDRALARPILEKMLKSQPEKEAAKRNDTAMSYKNAAKEVKTSPLLMPFLPVKDIKNEMSKNLEKDVASTTPLNLKGPMKVLVKDAAGELSQNVALKSGAAGERYPRELLATTTKVLGDEPLFTTGPYSMTFGEAGESLKLAGPLDAAPDPKNDALAGQITGEFNKALKTMVTPETATLLAPTVQTASRHLAKEGNEMGEALKHLLQLMNAKGKTPLTRIQGIPHTYRQATKKIEAASSLSADKVDKGTYETIRSKLKQLVEEHPAPEFDRTMPGVIDKVSKFLAKTMPESELEKRQFLSDALDSKGNELLDVEGMYKLTYQEAGKEVFKAEPGGGPDAWAVPEDKIKKMYDKLERAVPDKNMQQQMRDQIHDTAAHLAGVMQGRSDAMQAIYNQLKKEGPKPLASYGTATITHAEAAAALLAAPNFVPKPTPPGLTDTVLEHIEQLAPQPSTSFGTKHLKDTENLAANVIASVVAQKGGFVPSPDSDTSSKGGEGDFLLGPDGKPLYLLGADGKPILDANGKPIPIGADGKPIPLGADGKPIPLGADGKLIPLGADGKPIPLGADGKPIPLGADGKPIPLGADGKPIPLGADGKPLPLGADGKPRTKTGADGVAICRCPADGKPILGADGKPLTVGADGKPLTIGADGKPLIVGADGKPLTVGADGKPLTVGAGGKPLTVGADGKPLTIGAGGKPLTVGADGKPLSVGAGGKPIQVGADGKPTLGADGKSIQLGADGKPITAGAVGVALGGPSEYSNEEEEERRRKLYASGGRPQVRDAEHTQALTLLQKGLRAKGNETFYKQGQYEITHAEAADVLNTRPNVDKAISEAQETDRLARKLEKKLADTVINTTPPNLRDAMTNVIIESARDIAEYFTSKHYSNTIKEGLISEMQKHGDEILVETGDNAETFFFAAQRLKLATSLENKEPCAYSMGVTREIYRKLDTCIRCRPMARRLSGITKAHVKHVSNYLAAEICKPNEKIAAFVALLKEMEAAGDRLLVGGSIPKTYKDAASYLRSLTSFEDAIKRPNAAVHSEIVKNLTSLTANITPPVKTSIMSQVIKEQATLLTSYLQLQGEKTEILEKLVAEMEKQPNSIILRHGSVCKNYSEAIELLEGKNMDQLQNVPSPDPVVARKLQIKLETLINNISLTKPQKLLVHAVLDEIINYLAIHLLEPQIIKVCKCMNSVFVQCELWCEEILRRVARPCCSCLQHVPAGLVDELAAQYVTDELPAGGPAPSLEIKVSQCPTQSKRTSPCPSYAPSAPCPHARHSPTNLYHMSASQHFEPASRLSPTRLTSSTTMMEPEPVLNATPPLLTDGESMLDALIVSESYGDLTPSSSTERAQHAPFFQTPTTMALYATRLSRRRHRSLRARPSRSLQSSTSHSSPRRLEENTLTLREPSATNIEDYNYADRLPYTTRSTSPAVSSDQMSDLHAMMVSLMWNVSAWRDWLQEIISRALSAHTDSSDSKDANEMTWKVFQQGLMTEASRWRQYNVFSRQLILRLVLRYRGRQIVSPTRATEQTRAYIQCQREMVEMIDTLNKWTQWLMFTLRETETLRPEPGSDIPLHELCWDHFRRTVEENLQDWINYNIYLKTNWECKYKDRMAEWQQEGLLWVVSAGGTVPKNAVPAGFSDGERIWLARTTHNFDVLPAALVPSKQGCLVYADGAVHECTKYQVMCNADVEWVPWRAGGSGAAGSRAVRVAPGVCAGRVHYRLGHLVGPVRAPLMRCHVLIYGRPYDFDCYELLVVHV